MRKNKSVLSVDKLTLCYVADDKLINRLNEVNELTDSDKCFRLVRTPNDKAVFANSFDVLIKSPFDDEVDSSSEKKIATLKNELRTMVDDKENSYVWLYIENWVFYETFTAKHNWLAHIGYITDELGLTFNNITDLHIAMDTNINIAKKIKRAQFNDDYELLLNGTSRSNKKEILDEILHVQTGDQCRLRTLTIYIRPKKKKDGLSLRIYDKRQELEKSNKQYITQWNGLNKQNYRVELTLKNEHLKEYYKQGKQVVPDEILLATLASQEQSQSPLFDIMFYFSNRLLRFHYKSSKKPISIFQL